MNDFIVRLRRRNIPDADLLNDLRYCAAELSRDTLTAIEYSEKGTYGVNTFLRRFKSWNAALEAAGLSAPNRQNIRDEELFENIAAVWTCLGRQPVGKDMEKSAGISSISLGTYEKRFTSWNNALLMFSAYLSDGKVILSSTEARAETKTTRRTSRKVNWRLRAQVLIRDNCICRMCGASPAKDPSVNLHADHIRPWSKGGETVLENLQTLCEKCNVGKSDLHQGSDDA